MKNMKTFKTTKSIILTALMVVGTLFTSCSSDDNESASIVGSWKSTKSVIETFKDGVSQGNTQEVIDANNYSILTYKADGRFSDKVVSSVSNYTEEGAYTTKDNVLSVKYDGNADFDLSNFTVTNSTLVIVVTEEYTKGGNKYKDVETSTYSRQ
jgi:hypothetical protein